MPPREPEDKQGDDGNEELLKAISGKQKALATPVGRASFAESCDAFLTRFCTTTTNPSSSKPPQKQSRQSCKALLRLAQDCLRSPEVQDKEAHMLLYECGCRAVGVLQEVVVMMKGEAGAEQLLGRMGMERLLYHAIARASELQRGGDMVGLLTRLATCLQKKARAGGDGGGQHGDDDGDEDWGGMDEDCGDWAAGGATIKGSQRSARGAKDATRGVKKGGRAATTTTVSSSKSKRTGGSGGGDSEQPPTLGGLLVVPPLSSVGADGTTAITTLVKLVCGALINAVRCMVESGNNKDTKDKGTTNHTQVAEVLEACRPWLEALASPSSSSEEREAARGYADRVLKIAWRAAAAADEDDDTTAACRIRDGALALYTSLRLCPASQVLPQVLRAGLVLEKKGDPPVVLALYQQWTPLLLVQQQHEQQQQQQQHLDYLRHYSAMLCRANRTDDALSLVMSSSSLPISRCLLLLHLVPLIKDKRQQSEAVERALTSLASALEGAGASSGGQEDEMLPTALLVRAWKALLRLVASTNGTTTNSSTATPAALQLPPATLLSTSLALCCLCHHLLSLRPHLTDPNPRSLQTALLDSRLRCASLLLAPSTITPSTSPSLPHFLPTSVPPPHPDPFPLSMSLLLSATTSSSPPPSSSRRRLGTAWFTMGRLLLDRHKKPLRALGPLLHACTLLAQEAQAATSSPTQPPSQPQQPPGNGSSSSSSAYLDTCRALQMDARLLTLAVCLRGCGAGGACWSRRAASKAACMSAPILTTTTTPTPAVSSARQPGGRSDHVRKLVKCRVLSYAASRKGVDDSPPPPRKQQHEDEDVLRSNLAAESTPWAWDMLQQLLGGGGGDEEKGRGGEGRVLDAWSISAAVAEQQQRQAPETTNGASKVVALLAREEMAVYEECLSRCSLDTSQAKACAMGHAECVRIGGLSQVEAALATARLVRVCVAAGRGDVVVREEEEGGAEEDVLGWAMSKLVEVEEAAAPASSASGLWVKAVVGAEKAALASAMVVMRRRGEAAGEEDDDEDRRQDEEEEQRQQRHEEEGGSAGQVDAATATGVAEVVDGNEGEEEGVVGVELGRRVWAREAMEALAQVVRERTQQQQWCWWEQHWPECVLGPRETSSGVLRRTVALLWDLHAGGGMMLGQAQLVELSLQLQPGISSTGQGSGVVKGRPSSSSSSSLLSAAFFLAACPDLGRAYLPSTTNNHQAASAAPHAGSGSKGASASRSKQKRPAARSKDAPPAAAPEPTMMDVDGVDDHGDDHDDDVMEEEEEGAAMMEAPSTSRSSTAKCGEQRRQPEVEDEERALMALANTLAMAESEGFPFTQARQALQDLTSSLTPPSAPLSLLCWSLAMAGRVELAVRSGMVKEALQLLRTLVGGCGGRDDRGQQHTVMRGAGQEEATGVVRLWRPSSLVPACLLRMGRAWEELGVASKARHYYDKARAVAGRWGAWAVEEESRGRAKLLRMREGAADAAAVTASREEEEGPALVVAEGRRREGRLGEAMEGYGRAMEQLHQQLEKASVVATTTTTSNSSRGGEARVEIWRCMAEAMVALGEKEGARGLLVQCAQEEEGARAVDRALARARLVGMVTMQRDRGQWREGAIVAGRRTRCPAVYREVGRDVVVMQETQQHHAGSSKGGEEREDVDVRAFLLAASVGTTFWNLPEAGGEEEGTGGLVVEGEEGWGLWEGQEEEEERGAKGGWRDRARRRMEGLKRALPDGWCVCVVARDGGGGVSMARVESGGGATVVGRVEGAVVAEVVEGFKTVMEGNRRSMRGGDDVAGWGRKEKVAWWAQREALDGELEQLLWRLEEGLGPWGRAMLAGRPLVDNHDDDKASRAIVPAPPAASESTAACRGGTSKSSSVKKQDGASLTSLDRKKKQPLPSSSSSSSQACASSLSRLTVAQLRQELSKRCLATSGLKAALLERLKHAVGSEAEEKEEGEVARRDVMPGSPGTVVEGVGLVTPSEAEGQGRRQQQEAGKGRGRPPQEASSSSSPPSSSSSSSPSSSRMPSPNGGDGVRRGPVVLVLDETLQALPWEAMPMFKGRVVTRCPSLAYVARAIKIATTTEGGGSSWQGNHITTKGVCVPADGGGLYVLDPEANLARTRATLEPVLQRCGEELGWKGLVGQPPTQEAFRETLGGGGGVYVYCGHGSGEAFMSKQEVARSLGPSSRRGGALAVLMGCSSGRLRPQGGDFEPTGMVHAYLHAGSPAVVANLWDVTDKDIDRFSTALLHDMLSLTLSSSSSLCLGECVSRSREACKLPYLVGAAPVIYGLPVEIVRSTAPSPPPQVPSRTKKRSG